MKNYFLDIAHKPFADGTPRHTICTIRLDKNPALGIAEEIVNCFTCWEHDNVYDYYELHSYAEEYKRLYGELLEATGVYPSMYVELYIKVANADS